MSCWRGGNHQHIAGGCHQSQQWEEVRARRNVARAQETAVAEQVTGEERGSGPHGTSHSPALLPPTSTPRFTLLSCVAWWCSQFLARHQRIDDNSFFNCQMAIISHEGGYSSELSKHALHKAWTHDSSILHSFLLFSFFSFFLIFNFNSPSKLRHDPIQHYKVPAACNARGII